MFLRSFLLFLLIPMLAYAAPVLKDVRVEAGEVLERVAFQFNERVEYKDIFTLENPDRLVIDLPVLGGTPPLEISRGYRGALLKDFRAGRFNETTTRIVCDLTQEVTVENIYLVSPKGNEDWQLVVDIASTGALVSPYAVSSTTVQPEKIPMPVKKPRKPLVVIDAGHGGKDPGAVGRSGLYEKEITLAYAKALEQLLKKRGGYEVMLTRSSDYFILLHERVNKARDAGGDVFISLHADSNPNADAQGFSVYTLSETASDKETAALARRENKADIIAGYDFEDEDADVADILIDLATRATKNRSSFLAETVVDSMSPKVSALSNTHRFAGFRVLKAPDIPSILIELGFLTNRQDEKLLQSREYQSRLVSGIADALDTYFAKYPPE